MISTKKISKYLLNSLFTFVIALAKAQSPWCATVGQTLSPAAAPPQTSNCVQLIDNVVPTSNDPILDVKVNFWVFAPAYTNTLEAVWTHSLSPSTAADAQNALNVANNVFNTLSSTPQLTVPGVPSVTTNPHIRLVLNNFNVVISDYAYLCSGCIGGPPNPFSMAWYDRGAINVFFGSNSYTAVAGTPPSTYIATTFASSGNQIATSSIPGIGYLKNNIVIDPVYQYTLTPTFRRDNVGNYGGVLAHEVGHFLGLNHPTGPYSVSGGNGEVPSFVMPTFGCCTLSSVEDTYMEVYTCFTCIPQQGCNTPGASDNLMSSNSGCNRYLSPQQMGIMNYNLRTVLLPILTPASYNLATSANPAFNYSVTANEIWANGDRYIKGDIRIKSGKTLKIQCGVAMTKNARIVVEPGAQLIIDGGNITNISGRTWKGIEVMGDPFLSQTATHPTNPGALLNQGIVRIINGGKISHADIGVKNCIGNAGYAGGVVITDNAIFENNVKDAQLSYPVSAINPLNNTSKFVRTKFITNDKIGEVGVVPLTHVELKNINGIQFLGCTFQYSATPNIGNGPRGDGITSSDAVYYVTNFGTNASVFNGMYRGVYVNNVNPLKVPTITNTLFKEITGYGAYFLNTNYLAFQTNTIQSSPNAYYTGGVYLNNCKYYKIKNNLFIQPLAINAQESALNIYRSKAGAHEIYRNIFSNVKVGINCMDDNSGLTNYNDGLLMNCNVFNQMTNLYDIALTYTNGLAIPSVMYKQGETQGPNQTAFNLVRNIYGASCGNQNKWYVYSSSTKPINHGANTNSVNAVTQPTQSGCSSTLLNIVNSNIPLDYPNHCALNPLSSGGSSTVQSQRLANLNGYIGDLQANNSGNQNHFEIQSSVASKLYEFLTDSTATPMDSVINILTANSGNMADANVQLVFAYLANNDYVNAGIKANQLPTDKIDWKNYLLKLIDIRQNPEGEEVLCDNTDNFNYLITYADTDNKDGQASAQALLKVACNREYTEPHALPEGETSHARTINPAQTKNGQIVNEGDGNLENSGSTFDVFPNPTTSNFTIRIKCRLSSEISYIITDLLGHQVKTGLLYSNVEQEISTNTLKNGIYFLTLIQEGKYIGKEKLILMR